MTPAHVGTPDTVSPTCRRTSSAVHPAHGEGLSHPPAGTPSTWRVNSAASRR
ncbi:MAG TPA: hypothetical protein VGP02_04310 [Mycobacteriales bacterium]|nr:hypothetical protein [Mycobacteriales bacterium]